MQHWLIFSLAGMGVWGAWGFLTKLSSQHISPRAILLFQEVGALVVVLAVASSVGFKPDLHAKGTGFAVLAGSLSLLGALLFIYAVRDGKLSVVVPITALYPIVTILLSALVLKEAITFQQGLGILLGVIAIILLSV